MAHKIIAIVIVCLALIVAILATFLPKEMLGSLIMITNFFDIMLPILAVGALMKYLLCCPKK